MSDPDSSPGERSWETLPVTRGCFVCGIDNPTGLRLALQSDGRTVEVPVRFRAEHCGFSGVVHGACFPPCWTK